MPKFGFGKGARVQFENRIGIDKIGGDDIAGKRLSGSQTVSGRSQLGRVAGDGNQGTVPLVGTVYATASGGREIVGGDGIHDEGELP